MHRKTIVEEIWGTLNLYSMQLEGHLMGLNNTKKLLKITLKNVQISINYKGWPTHKKG